MKNFKTVLDNLSHDDVKGLYTALYSTNNIIQYINIITSINTVDDVVALRTKYTAIRRKEIIDSLL